MLPSNNAAHRVVPPADMTPRSWRLEVGLLAGGRIAAGEAGRKRRRRSRPGVRDKSHGCWCLVKSRCRSGGRRAAAWSWHARFFQPRDRARCRRHIIMLNPGGRRASDGVALFDGEGTISGPKPLATAASAAFARSPASASSQMMAVMLGLYFATRARKYSRGADLALAQPPRNGDCRLKMKLIHGVRPSVPPGSLLRRYAVLATFQANGAGPGLTPLTFFRHA
jgi:hypothetical protein